MEDDRRRNQTLQVERLRRHSRRLTRSENEKLRRCRLNTCVAKLADIMATAMGTDKKLDRSSILRLTVNYLRIYYGLRNLSYPEDICKSGFIKNPLFTHSLLKSINGFLFVITKNGTINYVSDGIASTLGHDPASILGCPLFSIIHPDDHGVIMHKFSTTDERLSFYVRMAHLCDNRTMSYRAMHVIGSVNHVSSASLAPDHHDPGGFGSYLVGVASVIECLEPAKELQILINMKTDEWVSWHDLAGKIIYSDQRRPRYTGFMPAETNGCSPYLIIYPDDIPNVGKSHSEFVRSGSKDIVVVWRTLTKDNKVLYLKTGIHGVINMWTSKLRYIITVNSVLSAQQGKYLLAVQQKLPKQFFKAGDLILTSIANQPTDASATRSALTDGNEVDKCNDQKHGVASTLEHYIELSPMHQYDLQSLSADRRVIIDPHYDENLDAETMVHMQITPADFSPLHVDTVSSSSMSSSSSLYVAGDRHKHAANATAASRECTSPDSTSTCLSQPLPGGDACDDGMANDRCLRPPPLLDASNVTHTDCEVRESRKQSGPKHFATRPACKLSSIVDYRDVKVDSTQSAEQRNPLLTKLLRSDIDSEQMPFVIPLRSKGHYVGTRDQWATSWQRGGQFTSAVNSRSKSADCRYPAENSAYAERTSHITYDLSEQDQRDLAAIFSGESLTDFLLTLNSFSMPSTQSSGDSSSSELWSMDGRGCEALSTQQSPSEQSGCQYNRQQGETVLKQFTALDTEDGFNAGPF